MSHTCHARACNTEVPPKMFMCRKHWIMVPGRIRRQIWANYVPGQEITKTPTQEYLRITKRAIAIVAEKEGLVS